jgi:hypothetical protein
VPEPRRTADDLFFAVLFGSFFIPYFAAWMHDPAPGFFRPAAESRSMNSWGRRIVTPEKTIDFSPVAGVSGYFSMNQGFHLSITDSHFKGLHFGGLLPEENLRLPLDPY